MEPLAESERMWAISHLADAIACLAEGKIKDSRTCLNMARQRFERVDAILSQHAED